MNRLCAGLAVLALGPLLGGCVVAQVTGAAVGATGAVVSGAARTTGAVADAALPDGDDEDEDDDRDGRRSDRR